MRGKIRTDRRTFLTSKLDWTEIDYAQRWRDSRALYRELRNVRPAYATVLGDVFWHSEKT